MIRVVLVAPALAFRAGLRALLQGGLGMPSPQQNAESAPSFEVVAEAARLADLGELPPQTDVLLITSAAALQDLTRLLQDRPGEVAVLLLLDQAASLRSLVSLPVRAWGVLSEEASPEELIAALQALKEGLLVGTPDLFRPLLDQLPDRDPAQALVEPLTDRETEILQLLAQGLANKQIAVALGISEHTVKFHVSAIYSKLDAGSRTDAVRLGVQLGLITL